MHAKLVACKRASECYGRRIAFFVGKLSKMPLVTTIGVDTAENGPSEEALELAYTSPSPPHLCQKLKAADRVVVPHRACLDN